MEFRECIHRFDGTPHLVCKHCKIVLAHPNRNAQGTTTPLSRHLSRCGRYLKNLSANREGPIDNYLHSVNSQGQSELPPPRITTDAIVIQILRFFVSGNIAFNQAENPEFKRLIAFIENEGNPAKCPTRKILRSSLQTVASNAKDSLRTCLMTNDSRISLALDCWSSKNNYAFIGTYLLNVAYKNAYFTPMGVFYTLHSHT